MVWLLKAQEFMFIKKIFNLTMIFTVSGFKDQVPSVPQNQQEAAHSEVHHKPTTHHFLKCCNRRIYVQTEKIKAFCGRIFVLFIIYNVYLFISASIHTHCVVGKHVDLVLNFWMHGLVL